MHKLRKCLHKANYFIDVIREESINWPIFEECYVEPRGGNREAGSRPDVRMLMCVADDSQPPTLHKKAGYVICFDLFVLQMLRA